VSARQHRLEVPGQGYRTQLGYRARVSNQHKEEEEEEEEEEEKSHTRITLINEMNDKTQEDENYERRN